MMMMMKIDFNVVTRHLVVDVLNGAWGEATTCTGIAHCHFALYLYI